MSNEEKNKLIDNRLIYFDNINQTHDLLSKKILTTYKSRHEIIKAVNKYYKWKNSLCLSKECFKHLKLSFDNSTIQKTTIFKNYGIIIHTSDAYFICWYTYDNKTSSDSFDYYSKKLRKMCDMNKKINIRYMKTQITLRSGDEKDYKSLYILV